MGEHNAILSPYTMNRHLVHTGETLRTCSWSTLLLLSILHTRSSEKHGCAHKITQGKHKNMLLIQPDE